MSIWAGHPNWQGATQSPKWSLSSNSRAVRRARCTASVSLSICMPSVATVAHDGTSRPGPPRPTTHARQEVDGLQPSRKHKAGMSMPNCRAASSTVAPSGTSTVR